MAQSLEIRRSSASLWGGATGMRQLPVVSKYIDTSTCIGCKACEVACQEWNDLGTLPTRQTGTYQTMPALHSRFWNLIRFTEMEVDGGMTWLMRKDQCMHCEDPGCLAACPAPGAIVQYENGIVDVNPQQCIGCGYCQTGCPFDVPKFQDRTGKMAKCTLCVDRVEVGLEPACVKACPTGCLQFGSKTDMLAMGHTRVEQLKANGFAQAAVYDPPGVGGTGVITILAHGDHPEWYGLPADPHVPLTVRVWKTVLRPLGLLAMTGAVISAFGHYLREGPMEAEESAPLPPEDRGQGGGADTKAAAPLSGSRRAVAIARARDAEDLVVGQEIVRHRLASRAIHWAVATFFFLALLSGLPIWTPVFGWMALLLGGLSVCRWLHPWSGVVFFVLSCGMFFHWRADMRLEPRDRDWLGPKVFRYLRHQEADPDVGKYNGGQKYFFLAVSLGALGLLVSGAVLWFPTSFPQVLRSMGVLLHDITFVLFALAIVFHIYLGTAAEPGTFGSMTRGTVTRAWARLHHPRWYRKVTDEEPRRG